MCDGKIAVLKKVTLPNGRTFVARYKRIKRSELPPNIMIRRTYRQRAALRGRRGLPRQQGQRIFDFVKKSCKKSFSKNTGIKGTLIRIWNLL